jgi:hypothetical protein
MLEINPIEPVSGRLLEKSDPLRLFSPVSPPFSLRAAGGNVPAFWSRRKLWQVKSLEIVKTGLDVLNPAVVKAQLPGEIGDRLLGNGQTEFHGGLGPGSTSPD